MIAAAAVHAAVILSVGFVSLTRAAPPPADLDVILVHSSDDDTPDEADYLSTQNQAGGGTKADLVRPTSPFKGVEPLDTPGVAPSPQRASSPAEPAPANDVLLTQLFSDYTAPSVELSTPQVTEQPRQDIEQIERDLEMARLSAELDELLSRYAKRPRKSFISARTRQSDAATYMHEWVKRVERIGNLNYPAALRAKSLSGQLLLTVGIRRDGSVETIDIRRSSGLPALDSAAMEIVRMAAPFDPLNDGLKAQTDILYITRTWDFSSDNTLRSER